MNDASVEAGNITALFDPELQERRRAFRTYVTHALHEGLSPSAAVERADRLSAEEDKRFGSGEVATTAAFVLERNEQLSEALHVAEQKNAELTAEVSRLRRELEAERMRQVLESVRPYEPTESDV